MKLYAKSGEIYYSRTINCIRYKIRIDTNGIDDSEYPVEVIDDIMATWGEKITTNKDERDLSPTVKQSLKQDAKHEAKPVEVKPEPVQPQPAASVEEKKEEPVASTFQADKPAETKSEESKLESPKAPEVKPEVKKEEKKEKTSSIVLENLNKGGRK